MRGVSLHCSFIVSATYLICSGAVGTLQCCAKSWASPHDILPRVQSQAPPLWTRAPRETCFPPALFLPSPSVPWNHRFPDHSAFVSAVMSCFSILFPKNGILNSFGVAILNPKQPKHTTKKKFFKWVWQVLASYFAKDAPLHLRETDGKPRMDDAGRSGFAWMSHTRPASMRSYPILYSERLFLWLREAPNSCCKINTGAKSSKKAKDVPSANVNHCWLPFAILFACPLTSQIFMTHLLCPGLWFSSWGCRRR